MWKTIFITGVWPSKNLFALQLVGVVYVLCRRRARGEATATVVAAIVIYGEAAHAELPAPHTSTTHTLPCSIALINNIAEKEQENEGCPPFNPFGCMTIQYNR